MVNTLSIDALRGVPKNPTRSAVSPDLRASDSRRVVGRRANALGVKLESDEHRFVYRVRDIYYRGLAKVADVEVVHQATGFGISE
jgi:hypothetical protein